MAALQIFDCLIFSALIFSVPSLSAVNNLQFNGGDFKLSWNYLPESQEIEFKLDVKTTGYVALGLTKTNYNMQDLDLFVGGFDRRTKIAYLEDRYSTSMTKPTLDIQQDYTLVSGSEHDGITKICCRRKLNTNDDHDFQITAGDKVYFAWATHYEDYLRYHTRRGYSSKMYVLVPSTIPSTPSPTPPSTTPPSTTPSPTSPSSVNKLQFDNGNFNLTWAYLPASQEIEFKVRAKTTGYVAVGLTKTNFGMKNLDLFFAGVTMYSKTVYLKDKYVNGYKAPIQDRQQDYTLISGSEFGGITTIHCKRKLITNDKKDFQIRAGDKVYFAWATNYRNDYLSYHSSRGYSSRMYEIVPIATPHTTPSIIPSVTYGREMAFRNGDYLLFWKFDSSTNEIFFKVKARATGWVGLGFSNKNYNMVEMDVVIGGVKDGQGYIDDYYSYQLAVPVKDTQQDYTLLTAAESRGTTTFEFKRKINTGDDKDLQIKPGKSCYIGWAYHAFSDGLVYHTIRGYTEQKVILVPARVNTAISTKVSKATSSSALPSTTSTTPTEEIPQYTSSTTPAEEIPQYTSSTTSAEEIPQYTSSTTSAEEIPQYTSSTTSAEEIPQYTSSTTPAEEIPQYTSSTTSAEEIPQYTSSTTPTEEIPQYTSSTTPTEEIPQYTSSTTPTEEIPQYTSSTTSAEEIPQYTSSTTPTEEIPQYTSSTTPAEEIPQYTSSTTPAEEIPQYTSSTTPAEEIPQYTSSTTPAEEIPQYTSSTTPAEEIPQYTSSTTPAEEIPQYTSSTTSAEEIPQYTSSTTPAEEIPQYTSSTTPAEEIPQYTSSTTPAEEIPQYTSSTTPTEEIPQYTSSTTPAEEIPQYTSSTISTTQEAQTTPPYLSSTKAKASQVTETSSITPTPPLKETTSMTATSSIPTTTLTIAATPAMLLNRTTSSVSITYKNQMTFDKGAFTFSWKYNSSTEELFCKLEVKATGWVGLGFSDLNFWMRNMDVMIAGVRDGQGYVGDYFSDGETTPMIDTQQDWTLISAAENGGKTIVEVKRKLDTEDRDDHFLMPGVPYYISWAYHITSDEVSYLGYHMSSRGYSHGKVVLIPSGVIEVPPTVTTVTETKTVTETTTVTATKIVPSHVTTTVTVTVTASPTKDYALNS